MKSRFIVLAGYSFMLILLVSVKACTQYVKLTQVEPDATKWKFPVAHRSISGVSKYHLKYMTLQALADSVGFSLVGSGTVTNVATAFPVTGGPITNTGTIGVDTTDATLTALATQYDLSQKGNGTVTNVTGTTPIVITGASTVTPNVTISQSGSGTNGYLSSTDWNTFNNKEPGITSGTTSQYWRGDKTWQTLNTTNVAEGMYLYYTDARARSALTLTTTGSSGASTYNSGTGVLNIPTYTLAGLGGIGLTSLSATSPLSYNNTTGVFSMSQSGTASNGWLSSTDWNIFNNKVSTRFQLNGAGSYYGGDLGLSSRNTGTYPGWAYSLGTIFFDMPTGSNGQVLKHNGTGWTAGTDNNTVYDYWSVQANGGVAYALTNLANLNFTNGTGINWSRSGGTMTATNVGVTSLAAGSGISVSGATGGVTITNNSPFSFLGVQANAGTIGNTLTNGATLNLTGSGSILVNRSGNTFTISSSGGTDSQNLSYDIKTGTDIPLLIQNGSSVTFREGTGISLGRTASNVMTVTNTSINTDNQTLSFSSPTLSISGGNNVTLPVLPSGTVNQTLRYDGSAWNPTSMLQTTTSRVDINSWPGTVILGSKLMVNGNIQYNSVGSAATTVAGRDADGGLTGVTVGSGLSLSAGTLSSTATGTVTSIATNNGITGGTITSTGTVGLTGQALALHNLSSNGIIARTGAGTVAARTITAGSGVTVTNGDGVSGNPTITNTGVLTEVDGSITNEGYLGISTSGGAYLKGYNSSGTATGNGVQFLAGSGLTVATGGNNTNGGQIQYSTVAADYYGQMYTDGSASVSLNTSGTKIPFNSEGWSSGVTVSTASDYITIPAGTYNISYSLSLSSGTATGQTCWCRYSGSEIGYSKTYNSTGSASSSDIRNMSTTFIFTGEGTYNIDVYCKVASGSPTETVYNPSLSISRIK